MVTTGIGAGRPAVGFLAIGGCGVHWPGCCAVRLAAGRTAAAVGGCRVLLPGGGCWPYGRLPAAAAEGWPYGCGGWPYGFGLLGAVRVGGSGRRAAAARSCSWLHNIIGLPWRAEPGEERGSTSPVAQPSWVISTVTNISDAPPEYVPRSGATSP